MTIGRWDPFRNIATLQDRINRLFEDAFPRPTQSEDDLVCDWRPMVDIYETDDGLVIMADLPGVKKEDVEVEVKEYILTISGQRPTEEEADSGRYFRRERTCGTFQRAFTLRYMIAPESIKASFKNGVLRVQIPKPEEENPRQVSVKVE